MDVVVETAGSDLGGGCLEGYERGVEGESFRVVGEADGGELHREACDV